MTALLLLLTTIQAEAGCGAIAAPPNALLPTSQHALVFVDRTSSPHQLTLSMDKHGGGDDVGLILPVPVDLESSDVSLGSIDDLDIVARYTGPLIERVSDRRYRGLTGGRSCLDGNVESSAAKPTLPASDVDILGSFTRGAYDIHIVAAEGSEGLQAWLDLQGFEVPDSGRAILDEYLESGVNFLVVRADLEEEDGMLRPLVLQMETIDSIPIRMGTINSPGVQDLTLIVHDFAPVEVITYPQVFPQNECIYSPDHMGDPDAFFSALLDSAHADQPAAWSLQYSDSASPYAEDFEEFEEALLGLTSAGRPYHLTRVHMRYTPETVVADLQLGLVPNREPFQHITFQDDLGARDRFDLCCDAWEGKRCPVNTGAPACSVRSGSPWALGLLGPLFLLFRRRR